MDDPIADRWYEAVTAAATRAVSPPSLRAARLTPPGVPALPAARANPPVAGSAGPAATGPGLVTAADMCVVLSGSATRDEAPPGGSPALRAASAPDGVVISAQTAAVAGGSDAFTPLDRAPDGPAAGAVMVAELRELAGQLFRAISADPVDRQAAHEVGARLVRIGFTEPEALARTIEVLGPSLSAVAGTGRTPAVFAILGAVASGHGTAARGRDRAAAAERQRAEIAALRGAERARQAGVARFRAVFDQAGIGALVVADAGEIVEVNDTASQIVGRDLTHLSIGDVWDQVYTRDRAEVIDMWAAARAGRPGHGIWRLDRTAGPDGGPVWVALTATMVEDEAGNSHFAVTIEDVTDRPDPRYSPERAEIGPPAARSGAEHRQGAERVGVPGRTEPDGAQARAIAAARATRSIAAGLRGDQFVVHYQPIVRLLDGKIQGAEALVRWDHPRLGLRLPEDFIAVAEESGLIVPLGLHVLETACRDAAHWVSVAAAAPELGDEPAVIPFVSVNLSVRQLEEPDLAASILDIVERTGIEPGQLQLELVESLMLDAVGQPLEALRTLAGAGIRIAIDDFGTGYSNFAYLPTLPVRALKLAGQFVGSPDDELGAGGLLAEEPSPPGVALDHMVEGIVSIAHRLGHTVTIEAVETREQAARMLALGADLGQGHLFGHPICADKLSASLARQHGLVPGPHLPALPVVPPVPSARGHLHHDHAATHRRV